LDAPSLRDASGAPIVVPPTSFTTRDDTPPVYSTDALSFSFPDPATGLVKITAPVGSFPPGTDFLVIDSGNGVVLTFEAELDGGVGHLVPVTLSASIDDQLLITITDPQGNVTTYTRSKYVSEDGRTAIGPGGGTVEGSGGVELRVPAGALDKGVELRLVGVTAEELGAEFPGQIPALAPSGPGPAVPVAGRGNGTAAQNPRLKNALG